MRICSGEDDGKCAIKCFFFEIGFFENNQRVDFCWLVEDQRMSQVVIFVLFVQAQQQMMMGQVWGKKRKAPPFAYRGPRKERGEQDTFFVFVLGGF